MSDLGVNWGLGVPRGPSAAEKVMAGFQLGRQERKQADLEKALGALGGNMSNPDAIARVYQLDPGLGASLETAAFQRQERSRAAEGRSALSDYILGGAAPASTAPSSPAPIQLADASGGAAGLSGMGAPAPVASPRDEAFARLVRSSPEMAFKVRENETAERVKQIELAEKLNEYGAQLLGMVTDQPSYDAAKARYNAVLQQFKLPPAALPAVYDPGTVRQLQMSVLSVKEQLSALKPLVVAPGSAVLDPLTLKEAYRNPVKPSFMKVMGPDGNETIVELPSEGGGASGGVPRGVRNNNPGNIEDGEFARSQPGYRGSDGRFAIFDSPDAGVAAKQRLLGSYMDRGLRTPAAIIGRWAPASENGESTANYAAYVSQRLGISPNDPIPPSMIPQLAEAMGEFETGQRSGGGPRVAYRGGKKPSTRAPAGVVRVSSIDEARALPSGQKFIDPTGTVRVRP